MVEDGGPEGRDIRHEVEKRQLLEGIDGLNELVDNGEVFALEGRFIRPFVAADCGLQLGDFCHLA